MGLNSNSNWTKIQQNQPLKEKKCVSTKGEKTDLQRESGMAGCSHIHRNTHGATHGHTICMNVIRNVG